MSKKADKFDAKKADLSLIPAVAEEAVARAMMYGEKKYGRYNYCKGHEASQLIAAAKRHLSNWMEGEENDPESGVSHLGHAMANCLMILHQQQLGTLRDNRHATTQKAQVIRMEPQVVSKEPQIAHMVDERTGRVDVVPYYPGSEGAIAHYRLIDKDLLDE